MTAGSFFLSPAAPFPLHTQRRAAVRLCVAQSAAGASGPGSFPMSHGVGTGNPSEGSALWTALSASPQEAEIFAVLQKAAFPTQIMMTLAPFCVLRITAELSFSGQADRKCRRETLTLTLRWNPDLSSSAGVDVQITALSFNQTFANTRLFSSIASSLMCLTC